VRALEALACGRYSISQWALVDRLWRSPPHDRLGSTLVIRPSAANDRIGWTVLENPTAGRHGVLSMATGVKVDEARGASRGHDWRREGDQLGQFPQVLGGGGEEELVAGAGGAT